MFVAQYCQRMWSSKTVADEITWTCCTGSFPSFQVKNVVSVAVGPGPGTLPVAGVVQLLPFD